MEVPNTIDAIKSEFNSKDDDSLLSHSDDEDCDMEAIVNAARFFSGGQQSGGKRPGGRQASSSSSSSHPSQKDRRIIKNPATTKRSSISCSSTSSNATLVRRNYHQRASLNNSSHNNSYSLRQLDSEASRGSSSLSSQGSGSETAADISPDENVVIHRDCGESSSSSSHTSSAASSIAHTSTKSFRGAESLDILRQIEEGGDEVDSEEDCSYTTNNDAGLSTAGSSLNSASILGVSSLAEGGSAAPSLMASSTSSSTNYERRRSGLCLPSGVRRHSNTVSRSLTSNRGCNMHEAVRSQSVNYSSPMDDDDELEVAQFTEALSRLSSKTNSISTISNKISDNHNFPGGSFRSRTGSGVASGSFISRTSGSSLLGKRRSHTDMAEAAAEAAKFFEDSESLDSSSHNYDDDQSGPSQQFSRRTSGTSVGTSSLDRLSLSQQPPTYENMEKEDFRPRKRLSASSSSQKNSSIGPPTLMSSGRSPSSSSVLSSDDSYQNAFGVQYRLKNTTLLPTIPGSNSSNLAAACAAAVAAEMERRTSFNQEQLKEGNSINSNQPPHISGTSRRRMQRRVAFSVSSIETEAAQAQALRMQLLSQDRYESRKNRMTNNENSMSGSGRPVARRSLSYTSGIKMSSSIIASSMPEEQELVGESSASQQQPYIDDVDIERMSRSMMERRVLSLPDPNAIIRLSECSNLAEETDFSSAAASFAGSFISRYSARSSFVGELNQFSDKTRRDSLFYESKQQDQVAQQLPESVSVTTMQVEEEANDDSLSLKSPSIDNDRDQIQQINLTNENSNSFPTTDNQDFYSQIEDYITNSEYQNFNENDKKNDEMSSQQSNGEESFDGKNTNVFAVEAQSPNERNVSRAIHLATERNDAYVKSIVQACQISTRLLLDNPAVEFTGDVPLHIGKFRHLVDLLLSIFISSVYFLIMHVSPSISCKGRSFVSYELLIRCR